MGTPTSKNGKKGFLFTLIILTSLGLAKQLIHNGLSLGELEKQDSMDREEFKDKAVEMFWLKQLVKISI